MRQHRARALQIAASLPRAAPLLRPVVHHHRRDNFAQASRGVRFQSTDAPATVITPRWFSDLRSRIMYRVITQMSPELRKELAILQSDLDKSWLDTQGGQQGFLTRKSMRGLSSHAVGWGDMIASNCSRLTISGHVNNVVYNKWAESGRVNWLQKIATKNSPKPDAQYTKIMNTNGVSLIMKSIKTEYKFPVTFPDQINVVYKLTQAPKADSTSLFLEAAIYSSRNRRLAAKCYEELVVYNYRKAERATLPSWLYAGLRDVWNMQGEAVEWAEKEIRELLRRFEEFEAKLLEQGFITHVTEQAVEQDAEQAFDQDMEQVVEQEAARDAVQAAEQSDKQDDKRGGA
ncbi:hypothetical protein S40293_01231 [Stachybotrys chartarum IBT 40293]|nr:hypothetical protein S40293_01231 [Stachybotrys chartarum IBT 40293]